MEQLADRGRVEDARRAARFDRALAVRELRGRLSPPVPSPRTKSAREPDFIEVRGAGEHNLNIDRLKIPKRQLVVFTGVSGSGK